MEVIKLEDYLESRCELKESNVEVFRGIYLSTRGDPCSGCAFFLHCSVWDELNSRNRNKSHPKKETRETNKELAERLGISPRQASKMRRNS